MSDCMHFPDTVEEFMEQYKMTDTKQVYSNGTEYVPIFRMKQWFEHEKAQLSPEGTTSDLISKTETVEHLRRVLDVTVPITDYDGGYVDGVEVGISTVSTMPTVQPEPCGDKSYTLWKESYEELKRRMDELTSCSDSISRQAAIDLFPNNDLEWDTIDGYIAPHVVRRVIEELPSVQPEPQWIPVSERMPEDLSEVNVTWVNHNPEPYYEFTKDKPFTATAVYYKSEWYWYSATCVDYLAEYGRCDWNKVDKAIEIVAWMPLPEAYKPNK